MRIQTRKQMNAMVQKRREKLAKLLKKKTQSQIAREWGLSRQRIHQMVKKLDKDLIID